MTLKIVFLSVITVTTLASVPGWSDEDKGTLGVTGEDKGTLGYVKNRKKKGLQRQAPAEAADAAIPGKKKVEGDSKGTIGKDSANTSDMERAHATEEQQAVTACKNIEAARDRMLRLTSKPLKDLEAESISKLKDFEVEHFSQDPLREYLYVIVSTLATLDKAKTSGQWNQDLRNQETRLLHIRDLLGDEISVQAANALKTKKCP